MLMKDIFMNVVRFEYVPLFLKKTKLACRISCIYVVNRSIIFLLSYCRALGVDYFLKRSPYTKKFVRSVWRHYECCCLGNGHVRCSAFFEKTKLASWISCIYLVNR